jgi:SAM-dependent methyltransferase
MGGDLHDGFRDPARATAADLTGFLEEADRLAGFAPIHRALRDAIDPRPGMRILDAGCGIGLEAIRLAAAHPRAHVTGLDRNAELLEVGRRRAPLPNLDWVHADLTELDLPDASFDAIRTERVLMYLGDGEFEDAVGDLVRLLRPGGRLALFELDYGATILPPGDAGDAAAERVTEAMRDVLPQPWAGRRLPRLLARHGLKDVTATPFSFAVGEAVWRRIVYDTARGTEDAWLEEHAEAAARGEFVGAFTGILTRARRA